MSPSRRDAEAFIKDQMRIMTKHGSAPKLTAKRYKEVVAETEKSFQSMRAQPTERAKAATAKS